MIIQTLGGNFSHELRVISLGDLWCNACCIMMWPLMQWEEIIDSMILSLQDCKLRILTHDTPIVATLS